MSTIRNRRRKVVRTKSGAPVDVSGQAYSAGYQAIPHIWFNRPIDLPPFSFATIRGMLIDPEIRLNFATRAAPITSAQFGWKEGDQWKEGIKCKHPEIAQFIYRQLQKVWRNFLPAILRAQVWGWSGGEVVLKLGENRLIEIDKLEPRHASDIRLLKDGFKRWGIVVDRVEDRGSVYLPFPYCWFHSYNAEDGDDYGVSAAHGAYSPWADKWFNGGAKDVRRLFMHKDAYGGVDLGYPPGETWVSGIENPVPNADIAKNIVEQLRTGGVTTRPSERDENGNEKWPLTRASVTANPQHILDYPKDLDAEMRHGMEIPDGVSDAANSGEWAGKRVTVAAFYASLDQWVVQILCDLKEQIFDHLCRLNFGSVPNYEISHKPLAEQAMEQQSNAGPGKMPGQAGPMPPDMQGPPGQMPPLAPPNPVGMSLVDALGSSSLTAAEALEAGRRAVRLALAQSDDDASGHEHRGKGPGGGQFVSQGDSGSSDSKSEPSKAQGNAQEKPTASAGKLNDATPNKVPGPKVDDEATTPPPPEKAFRVNVEETHENGITKTARVGIPGRVVPPPPKVPLLPNLTKRERRAERDFVERFESDPNGMAQKYRDYIAKTDKPYTFETDQAKMLSDDWVDEDLEKQMKKRQSYNNALHQTANAIVKRAFLQHLDTLSPGDNVLVTVGGCGSGKGYTLKNTELGKGLTAQAKAVWDSAGDQNATENPWILDEAQKRGLTVTYAYVAGDPKVAWADPGRGVVTRAHDPKDGRMVDAAVFADSYVIGARNHHAFHQKEKNNPNAKFLFFSAKDQSVIDGVPPESLKTDRMALYHWAMGSIQSRSDVSPAVLRGATQGARIWNDELGG